MANTIFPFSSKLNPFFRGVGGANRFINNVPNMNPDLFTNSSTLPPLDSPRFVKKLSATPLNIETDQTDDGIIANDQMPSGPLYFSRGYGERGTPTTMREKVTDFFTAPFREPFDIAQVKAPGSALGGFARAIMPLVTSAIPGAGLLSLVPRIFGGDTQPTFYETEGVPVDRIAIGPNMTWLGGNIAGGGQYVPNTQLDMAALGDAPTGAMGELVNGEFVPNPDSWYQGRPLTVIDQQSEGYREIPSTYRIDPFGAASITSDDFGAPDVDYGDIYYGGADFEGLDTNDYGAPAFDIGGGMAGGFGETYDPGEDFAAAYGDWL